MKRYWYKTYVRDILSKEKMQMPHWLFHRLLELEAIAADYGEDGLLPPVNEIAWILRPVEDEKISESLQALSEIGEVDQTPEGWRLVHFKANQESDSAERVRKFRERRNAVKHDVTDVTDEPLHSPLSNSYPPISSEEGEGVGEGETAASIFTDSFGGFSSRKESTRWAILFEAAGKTRAEELITWALRKEIHLENRPGLMDSLETAAKNWKEKSNGNKPMQEPKGFEAGRRFLERHGVKNG